MNMSMLFGYTKREDGLYYKTVHFGIKGTAAETLVRNAGGFLVKVIRQAGNQSRSQALQRKPWTPEQRQARQSRLRS